MLLGIGMDLVDLDRMEAIVSRKEDSFLRLLLSTRERSFYEQLQTTARKVEWIAGRFAAKEAASKALGTGLTGHVTPAILEIIPDSQGKPTLVFPENLAGSFRGSLRTHVTITHTKYTAAAVVLLEAADSGQRTESNS